MVPASFSPPRLLAFAMFLGLAGGCDAPDEFDQADATDESDEIDDFAVLAVLAYHLPEDGGDEPEEIAPAPLATGAVQTGSSAPHELCLKPDKAKNKFGIPGDVAIDESGGTGTPPGGTGAPPKRCEEP